jgi:hypothetical protein
MRGLYAVLRMRSTIDDCRRPRRPRGSMARTVRDDLINHLKRHSPE